MLPFVVMCVEIYSFYSFWWRIREVTMQKCFWKFINLNFSALLCYCTLYSVLLCLYSEHEFTESDSVDFNSQEVEVILTYMNRSGGWA